ncbi:unnamed protein product [Urochloa humidicola]
MVTAGAATAPSRPRSARYAEKGYPNYADPDRRSAPRWRDDDGGGGRRGRAKKPEARRGRKRESGEVAEAALVVGKIQPPILQVEDEAEDQGRKQRRVMDAAASATAAGSVIEDGVVEESEVASADEGADESKSCRLRVKETLRMFSKTFLHCIQEEQQRVESVGQHLKTSSRLVKRQVWL